MKNAVQLSHHHLDQLINLFPAGTFIDATLGNGHDTAFILRHPAFKGKVIAFDIQHQAIQSSQEKLAGFPVEHYQLLEASHDQFDQFVSILDYPIVHGAVFNLGYLPGGDHQMTTRPSSTQAAIEQIANRLVKGGQIIVVIYSGHPQGLEEKQVLLESFTNWSQQEFQISHLEYINQKNTPPSLLIIEKI